MAEKLPFKTISGVRVLHIQNKSFLTNTRILTRVGSSAEADSEQGLAHILEHMFFKGSKNYPTGTSISRAANDIGGKMNAYTTYDHTTYYITTLNENFREGLDILADMYQFPLFSPEEFEKERNPILSEFRERQDDPDSYLAERSLEAYFGNAYHPVIGTEESIKSATVEDMHRFRKKYYGSNNMLIAIVGGVSEKEVEDAISELFGKTPNAQSPALPSPTHKAGELQLTKAGIQEAYYNLFFPALPPMHPDRYKQDLMNFLLGGNDSALLFERIREELGMSCYGIYSWVMRNKSFPVLGISCGIAPSELDKLHTEVLEQIRRIQEEKLEEAQLERAKAALRTGIAARSETSSGLNGMLAASALLGETEDPVAKSLEELEKITLPDIQKQAQSTFCGPMLHSVLLPGS